MAAPPPGFRFEVLEADGDTVCPETQTIENLERSTGSTSHHLLRLPLGGFTFRIILNNNQFEWHNKNALQVLIDFDNQQNNLKALILKDLNRSLRPQQVHFQNSRGERRAYIGSLTRISRDYEERLTFENQAIVQYGSATLTRRQGTIWVTVKHCNVFPSKIDHTPAPAVTTEARMPTQSALDRAGISSYIRLARSSPRTIQTHMFKTSDMRHTTSFILHYRVPQEFERSKSRSLNDTTEIVDLKTRRPKLATPESPPKLCKGEDSKPLNASNISSNVRLPHGDITTLTPEPEKIESDDDLQEMANLLDAIDTKQLELTTMLQEHKDMTASRVAALNTLIQEQANLQERSEDAEAEFEAEKTRLVSENEAAKQRNEEANGPRKRKLDELRDELKVQGLTLLDIKQEDQRLDGKVDRYKDSLKELSARKRQRVNEPGYAA